MRLHGTPLSHFTRKIRILLAELGVDFEFVRAPSVLSEESAAYGDNPLRRVPALVDGERMVIDSDHIARYLVAAHDPADRLGVRSERVEDLNRLAVANGVMDNEVVLILAQRTGVDVQGAYFEKLRGAIAAGLAWLDARATDDPRLDWADVAAICMWQHLEHYRLVSLAPYGRLAAHVGRFAGRPSVAATTPAVSLAEATAAGWKP